MNRLLLLLCSLLLVNCSQHVAGTENSSETTNGFVVGISSVDGTPIPNARVAARTLGSRDTAAQVIVYSDDSGRVTIPADSGVSYRLTYESSSAGRSTPIGFSQKVTASQGLVDLSTVTLEDFTTITVNSTVGSELELFLPGTAVLQTVPAGDSVAIGIAPALDYDLELNNETDTIHRIVPVTSSMNGAVAVTELNQAGVKLETTNPELSDSLLVAEFLTKSNISLTLWDQVVGSVDGRIRVLDLTGIGATNLHSTVENLGFLWRLLLDDNPDLILPQEIDALDKLNELSLRRTGLTEVPLPISGMDEIHTLHLTGNRLTGLPAWLSNASSLNILSVDSCGFSTVPPVIGDMTFLEIFNYSGNAITSLPTEIRALTGLHSLILENCGLQSLDGIGAFTSLKQLKVSSNSITVIPAEIKNLVLLEELFIGSNGLTTVPTELFDLTSMTLLVLSSNSLASLPPEIGNLTNMEYLKLEGNNLVTLPDEITNLQAIIEAKVHYNRLTAQTSLVEEWLDKYAESNWRTIQQ